MQATVTKNEALRLLRMEHQAVTDLIAELSDDEMTRGDTIRYGLYADQRCSFKDLLAHLICYEAFTLAAIDDWRRGQQHWVIAAVRDARQSRAIHYGGISERAGLSLREQLDEYATVSAALETCLAALSEVDWRGEPTFAMSPEYNLGGMIESIMVTPPRPMYRHLPVHVPDATGYIRSLRVA
ncbi:MAG: hypothetical protein OXG92_14805 [Chloroflexi bacterium]|nr:hypothetical protein [Chloroflexota bacterium]MCY3583978.1 hypothetical protein [Chloroflexota bacterium]MCY3717717.1 hypothetical protein [Chloroflexota bacterium]MDE2649295.1 hypothetical protein [Chloroflexota bacterium]MXV92951.1 hypothetical protein [Chloroflexota bacterium]